MRRVSSVLAVVFVVVIALVALLVWRGERVGQSPAFDQKERTSQQGENQPEAKEAGERPRHGPGLVSYGPGIASEPTEEQDETAEHGAIEGIVRSSATFLGVRAELVFTGPVTVSANCDDSGRFVFSAPAQGTYQLATATADGYLPFAPEWGHSPITVVAVPGRRIRGIIVELAPAVEYTGLVVAPSGEPVPGADVRILSASYGTWALIAPPGHYQSDPDGRFHFHAPVGVVLEARHAGYAPGRAAVGFATQVSRKLTIKLRAGQDASAGETIAGRVVDPEGVGVEGAVVVAAYEHVNYAKPEVLTATRGQSTTDEQGQFVLEGLDHGNYLLTATAADSGFAPKVTKSIPSGAQSVVLRLEEGGSLTGSVWDARTREPIGSFAVSVWTQLDRFRIRPVAARAFVDPNGEFSLPGLPAGQLYASVVAPSHAESDMKTVEIRRPPGAPTVVEFALRRGASARGTVVDRSTQQPIEGARIRVEEGERAGAGDSAMPGQVSAVTDAAGHFGIDGLKLGTISLLTWAEGYHGYVVSNIKIQERDETSPLRVELTPVTDDQEAGIELVGIGASLAPRGDDAIVVGRVAPGGGAGEAGLEPDDLIVAIDAKPVEKFSSFRDIIEAIRGPEGATVTLLVKRDGGSPEKIVIRRKRVKG